MSNDMHEAEYFAKVPPASRFRVKIVIYDEESGDLGLRTETDCPLFSEDEEISRQAYRTLATFKKKYEKRIRELSKS